MAENSPESYFGSRNAARSVSDSSEYYRRQLETVSNNATLALFIMNEHQQCVYMNPAAEQLTGFKLTEVEGRALHDVIHHTRPDGKPYPLTECPIDQAFPQNNREQGEEIFVHKNGSFYPVAYTASPIREASAIVGTIIEVRDITEEKRAQQQREELDRAKIAFFSNVSHELRTPLTLILGPIEDALADDQHPLPAPQRERAELIQRNAGRLLQLVNTLLDFSRLEAGRLQAVFAPTDLAAMTSDLASMFRSAVERAGLRFTVECPTLPESIYVDRDMWEKIVSNLLSNALKFTFDGEISLRLRWTGQEIELTVGDTGVGIPEHELPHLFERFHRVVGARARTHEGSGIGLALVQELVGFHGGTVAASSIPGAGSVFTVRIPAGTAHLPPERIQGYRTADATRVAQHYVDEALRWLPEITTSAAVEPVPAAPHGPPADCGEATEPWRVLLAEDNADMREYIKRLLMPDYTVRSVADGVAAVAAAREWQPHLLLTDIMMPGLDGLQVLQQLRANATTCEIPIIMLSARAGEAARVEGLRAGADDYLVKPFAARELQARVSTTIKLAQLRHVALRRQQEQVLRLQQLAAVSLDISAELALPDLLQLVTERSRNLLGASLAMTSLTAGAGLAHGISTVSPPYAAGNGHVPSALSAGMELYAMLGRDLQPISLTGTEIEAQLAKAGSKHQTPERPRLRGWMAAPLLDRDGCQVGLIQLVDKIEGDFAEEDVLVLRQLAQLAAVAIENARLYQAAQEAIQIRNEFVSVAAHELKTPVTSLRLAAQGLQRQAAKGREIDPARMVRSVGLIDRQADKLQRLTEQLLDVARLDSGRLSLDRQQVDLVALVQDVLSNVQPASESHAFEVHAPPALPALVDSLRLEQVLINVVTNAVKFSPEGGKIVIAIESTHDDHVVISVTDQGIGVPVEHRPYIFNRFFQAHTTTSFGGMGIGLFVSQQIIELHGGTMTATFPDGGGTRMVLRLPVQPVAAPAAVA